MRGKGCVYYSKGWSLLYGARSLKEIGREWIRNTTIALLKGGHIYKKGLFLWEIAIALFEGGHIYDKFVFLGNKSCFTKGRQFTGRLCYI